MSRFIVPAPPGLEPESQDNGRDLNANHCTKKPGVILGISSAYLDINAGDDRGLGIGVGIVRLCFEALALDYLSVFFVAHYRTYKKHLLENQKTSNLRVVGRWCIRPAGQSVWESQ